jgi:hypothetical protein
LYLGDRTEFSAEIGKGMVSDRKLRATNMITVIEGRGRSRRELFGDLAFFVGGASLLVAITAPQSAAAKVGPKDVGYQTTPKGADRCSNCVQWQAPHSCKVVSGAISPNGWCSIYARKA